MAQEAINKYLGGRVLAVFRENSAGDPYDIGFADHGFDPVEVDLSQDRFVELVKDIEAQKLWDVREHVAKTEGLLTLSPWGFRYLQDTDGFASLIGEPEFPLVFEPPK